MQIQFQSRHTSVPEGIRISAAEKLGRLERYLFGLDRAAPDQGHHSRFGCRPALAHMCAAPDAGSATAHPISQFSL